MSLLIRLCLYGYACGACVCVYYMCVYTYMSRGRERVCMRPCVHVCSFWYFPSSLAFWLLDYVENCLACHIQACRAALCFSVVVNFLRKGAFWKMSCHSVSIIVPFLAVPSLRQWGTVDAEIRSLFLRTSCRERFPSLNLE